MSHFTSIPESKKRSSPEENESSEFSVESEAGWTSSSKRLKFDTHQTTSNTSTRDSIAFAIQQIDWSQWHNGSTIPDPIPEPQDQHSTSSAAQLFLETFWEGVIIPQEEPQPIKRMTLQEIQEEAEDLAIIEMSVPDIIMCFPNDSIFQICKRQERAMERQSRPKVKPTVIHRTKSWYERPGATLGTIFGDLAYMICHNIQTPQTHSIPILMVTSPDGTQELLLEDFR
ncbi:uncharacterized protein MELLADRAFT_71462 [Melampsora larici-populina 98AG31]|uniref:Uncharacterized protein n=1 Tax=Melampsora larici-populina (strain 98AG31 / pathotype 3-4-7) TaxID=747676 RepID=F4RGR3_MELLP|nr:uncharacterized protein MELLADRAFT_71462 [Melampsora larici-populina 98AG31]EGG08577.1 hypothetical protein MELLADRAFT_71462 [Melampsora larici-populina 98AG31]